MSARSSEFVMTPSVQKTVPGADGARIVPAVLPFSAQVVFGPSRFLPKSLSAQHALKGPARTRAQQANQQGHTIQDMCFRRRSIRLDARKLPFEVARKVRGQPGCEIADQSLAGDLRQHSPQAVSDRKLDARCGALICRYEAIADLALRGRPAALIAADAQDPAGQTPEVTLDARDAAEIRGDRTESYADHASHPRRGRNAGMHTPRKAGGNFRDIAEHVEDPLGRISDREMVLKDLLRRKVRDSHRAAVVGSRLGFCCRCFCDI